MLSSRDAPWQSWEYLTRVSQLPAGEWIRSDAGARPDDIWGFPSYEAWRGKSVKLLLQVLTEPILADFFSPRAGTVFETMRREADRVSYWEMQKRLGARRSGHAG
ncbi:hypothetical protein [Actinomadura sp. WMMA1423]|uniref:hypothetical protein n=1 Tax=Actinomadura sp. WMMA1423 TaxID=2591108 RepID=UPI0011479194|nr:hypothetical protein [Actinomadura sp. WMMA1423]